jgi:hypothetical protein
VLSADNIHIEYSAPAACPSEAAFVWQVRARVNQMSAPARKYAVVMTVDSARARGTLRVEDENRSTVRELSGTSCDEIAEGLALILALVIDPGARTDRARDLPPPPAPSERPAVKPRAVLVGPVPDAASDASAAPARIAAISRPAVHLGGGVFARGAVAPGTTTSGRLFVEGGWDRPVALSPHLRVGLEYAKSSTAVDSVGTAQFSWMVGVVEVCHSQHVVERTLSVPICAGIEWGRVVASGSEAPDARTQTHGWLSIDMDVGLRWFPWSVPLFVDVEGGLQFPLQRARFYFTPNTTVHTTPWMSHFVGLGAGIKVF